MVVELPRVFAITTVAILISLLGASSTSAANLSSGQSSAADSRDVGASDSYVAPSFCQGARISDVYEGPQGHVVLGIAFRDATRVLHYCLYDTKAGTRLAADDEIRMANENAILERNIARFNLKRISAAFEFTNSKGVKWSQETLGGRLCFWPYNSAVRLEGDHIDKSFMIFSKRSAPNTKTYSRGCDRIAGDISLTTRYQAEGAIFYQIDGVGPYIGISDRPYLIRFKDDGTSDFFAGRDDVTLVDAEKVGPIVDAAGAEARRPQQSYIRDIENIVRAASAKQEHK